MKKEEIQKKLESAGDTDFVLRTSAEEQAFLENHKKQVIESELPLKVSAIHTQYDDDLFELFGERKKGDQKTYHFLKEKFGALKGKAEKVASLETEIAELKKGNPTDSARLAEIRDLQNTITSLKSAHDKELSDVMKDAQKKSIEAEIKSSKGSLKFKKEIPADVIDVYVNNVIAELSANAEFRDGKAIFLDPQTKLPRRNPTTLEPYSTSELLAERMKTMIDTGHQQPGPGIKPGEKPITKAADGKFQVNFTLPATVTSKQKLGEYLIKEQGLKSTTPEYREAYKQFAANLPLVDE